MGLIITRNLNYWALDPLENSSNVYVSIPKMRLSRPYNLPSGSILTGELLKVIPKFGLSPQARRVFDELKKRPIKFILLTLKGGYDDNLFISSETWLQLRDYGIFPDTFVIKFKINEVTIRDKTLKIYPKRDVSI